MKIILLLIASLHAGMCYAEMTLPTEIRGKCYIAEFNHPESQDKNILTICIKNNDATARMIYSNSNALSAVCYHKGTQSVISDDEFHIALKKGFCDNNRTFLSDNIICTRSTSTTFNCKSPKGKMTLKELHR